MPQSVHARFVGVNETGARVATPDARHDLVNGGLRTSLFHLHLRDRGSEVLRNYSRVIHLSPESKAPQELALPSTEFRTFAQRRL